MFTVYLLVFSSDDDPDDWCEILGVFSSARRAEAQIDGIWVWGDDGCAQLDDGPDRYLVLPFVLNADIGNPDQGWLLVTDQQSKAARGVTAPAVAAEEVVCRE